MSDICSCSLAEDGPIVRSGTTVGGATVKVLPEAEEMERSTGIEVVFTLLGCRLVGRMDELRHMLAASSADCSAPKRFRPPHYAVRALRRHSYTALGDLLPLGGRGSMPSSPCTPNFRTKRKS